MARFVERDNSDKGRLNVGATASPAAGRLVTQRDIVDSKVADRQDSERRKPAVLLFFPETLHFRPQRSRPDSVRRQGVRSDG